MFEKIAVIGICLMAPMPLFAAPAPHADKPQAHPSLNLDSTKKELESGDEARTLSALDEVELSGERKAAPLVEALLARGASSKILMRAMGVAGALGQESSSAAIAPYVKHRAAEVRRAAAQSLARTKGPVAVQALRLALHASDAALRGSAATGLGALGAKEAVPDLFVVLPKETPEAAGAIGTLCSADDCKKFLSLLGKLPFDTMQTGFLPLLLRTGPDVPDGVKLQLVEQLRRLATAKANELLTSALAAYPSNGSPKIRTAIDAALHGHSVAGDAP
ncbi:MAG TPA: HEAT repeat domain-containing protein [Polyangiaceae bacterium]|jgi:HEAT repeat protein|nr:HEAT repeat domain-containing protein [Polyangiaceae bacterium]